VLSSRALRNVEGGLEVAIRAQVVVRRGRQSLMELQVMARRH
jgi:hypothetical protein